MTRAPRVPRTCRRCNCATAVPSAPGDVPVMAAGFPLHEFLTIGSRAPVNRVLEHGGKGAIVLGRDEQHRIGRGDLRLEADNARRQLAFEVLVIEGRSSIATKWKANRPSPNLASACASFRLIES